MSINVKKYTKDQMAKMVEEAQAEVQELKRVNAALTEIGARKKHRRLVGAFSASQLLFNIFQSTAAGSCRSGYKRLLYPTLSVYHGEAWLSSGYAR